MQFSVIQCINNVVQPQLSLTLQLLHRPGKRPVYPLGNHSHSSSRHLLVTTNLRLASALACLDLSHKRVCVTCDLVS